MDFDKLNDVILYTSIRKLKNFTSQFLTTIEARIVYIKQLEATFILKWELEIMKILK